MVALLVVIVSLDEIADRFQLYSRRLHTILIPTWGYYLDVVLHHLSQTVVCHTQSSPFKGTSNNKAIVQEQ